MKNVFPTKDLSPKVHIEKVVGQQNVRSIKNDGSTEIFGPTKCSQKYYIRMGWLAGSPSDYSTTSWSILQAENC